MDGKDILKIFEEKGALLKGHFLLSSGLHSDTYLQCALVLQYPDLASFLTEELTKNLGIEKVDVVIGPALGGIILAYEVARKIGARAIFAERVEGRMQLRRGFAVHKGERVLLVEDVITTGASLKEVEDLVKEKGGIIVGIGTIVDRSGGNSLFGSKVKALLTLKIQNYLPEKCPLCRKGIPLTVPGSKQLEKKL
ncbi:orotate phosphoribosyltransferase [Candidatus Calescamantes bacterium]|nr:orotate phosphoribosyltransferase [Candidatus Calescamantes bacterium]